MMKLFVQILLFTSIVYGENVLSQQTLDLRTLKLEKTKSERETLKLLKNEKSAFALVRSDILFFSQKKEEKFDFQDYFIIGKNNKRQQLFLVGRNNAKLQSIGDFKNKYISVEKYNNLSSLYLEKIINFFEKSLVHNIGIEYYSVEDSLRKIKENKKENKLDFLFVFADEKFQSTIAENGLRSILLPKKFIEILKENKGLEITNGSVKVEHYLVCSNDEKKVSKDLLKRILKELKIKNMHLTEVDKSMGIIHPSIVEIFAKIEESKEVSKEMEIILGNIQKVIKTITKVTAKVKKELKTIGRNASNFEEELSRLQYVNKASSLFDEFTATEDTLKRSKLKKTSLKEKNDVAGLTQLYAELEEMINKFKGYERDAKNTNREIQYDLLKEKKLKEEEEKEKLKEEEAKALNMLNNSSS